MPNILFAAKTDRWESYEAPLTQALTEAGLSRAVVSPTLEAESVDYMVYAPDCGITDFGAFPRLKAVLNLWAGVEDVVGNPTLTVPLARMVDPGLEEGMVEWVVGHGLRHHLDIDRYIHGQDGQWRIGAPPLARDRKVTILGLGTLGSATALALKALNFQVSGWARREKDLPGVACHSGAAGLAPALQDAEIVVLLLPDTPATQEILNAQTIAGLAPGAVVLNPGRGALVDDAALLAALDSGRLSHATLDTFREEPLPPQHPFWSHPKVTVTPHIASETRPSSAARVIVENIRRGENAEPFINLVDRDAGY